MGFVGQCVIGTLAAAGLICILKTVYDIIFHRAVCTRGKAELYLYVDGDSAEAERLRAQVNEARRAFLPGLTVVWVDLAYRQFACPAQAQKGNRQRAANDLRHGHADRVPKY